MKPKTLKQTLIFLLFFSGTFVLSAQNAEKPQDETNLSEKTIDISGAKIELKDAIHLVLKQNLTLRSAKYDVIMSDSDFEQYQSKYSPRIGAEVKYKDQKMPTAGMSSISGDEMYQFDVSASISKLFSSGTTVSLGVANSLVDYNDTGFGAPGAGMYVPEDPAYHKPYAFIAVEQELLKNAFGYTDRRMNLMLKNRSQMARAALINQLSSLVVNALVDYWQVTITKKAVETAELELNTTQQVRNIIVRTSRLGLAETFDINQYNALVAAAQSKLALQKQQHRSAVRKLLRTINMPPETEVSGVTDLVTELPELDKKEAVDLAFKKRVDYQNAMTELQLAETEIELYENESLPSLTASGSINFMGQDEQIGTAFGDVAGIEYPTWEVGLKMSYPLWDEQTRINLRNSELRKKQAAIKLEDLRQTVRDEVLDRLEEVQLYYELLTRSENVTKESELYYNRLLRRSRQGKFNSVAVKNAMDTMIKARYDELKALIDYNIALLKFDLAKNEIFERFDVDVEKILQEVE